MISKETIAEMKKDERQAVHPGRDYALSKTSIRGLAVAPSTLRSKCVQMATRNRLPPSTRLAGGVTRHPPSGGGFSAGGDGVVHFNCRLIMSNITVTSN